MAQRMTRNGPLPMWTLSIATMILASGALAIILWEPRALWLALLCGVLGVASRGLFVRLREASRRRTAMGPSSAVANTGMALSMVAVVPLLAFALLWGGLLLIIGITWLLHAIGLA